MSPEKKRRHAALAVLVVAAGALLRAYELGGDSLWHDEAFTWYFTRMQWKDMLNAVRLDGVNPPIYYIATKALVDWFGDSEAVLRSVSLLAGAASMWGMWLVGNEAGGKAGGTAGLIFAAFHPMAVHYSRDARPYGLVLALSTFLLYFVLRLKKQDSKGLWWAAWAALLLGQLSHYFFFVLGGTILFMAFLELRKHPLRFRKWAMVWLGAFIPLGVWLWWYFAQPAPSLGIGWIKKPEIWAVFGTTWNLFSGYGGTISAATTLFGVTSVSLAAAGMASKVGWRDTGKEWFVWLLFPMAAVWLVSQRRPVYVDRYFIVFLPAAAYLTAAGAAAVLDRWRDSVKGGVLYLATGLILLVGIWAGWGVHVENTYSREDWRGLVGYLNENREEGEGIWLSEPEASIPMQYYLRGDLSNAGTSNAAPRCSTPCWWVMRQAFTATHAFSQSLGMTGIESFPELPVGCELLDSWESESGLMLWRVLCEDEGA